MDEVKKQTRRTPAERETEEVAEQVRRLFFYHAETGLIIFRQYWRGRNVGEEVGWEFHSGNGQVYRDMCVCGCIYKSHRIAWLFHYGKWPSLNIDHRDGNGLNNRITNLREATVQQNGMNRKLDSRNSCGVTGVRWCKNSKKWNARITFNKQLIQLGYFLSFEDAVKVRKEAEKKYGFSDQHGRSKTDMGSPDKGDRIP